MEGVLRRRVFRRLYVTLFVLVDLVVFGIVVWRDSEVRYVSR